MRSALLGIGMILASTSAQADWASGGGQVIKDSQNPWFIQNTTSVDVCIIWDQDHFHPVDQNVSGLVSRFQHAVNYWKTEFKKSFVVSNYMQVATQEFNVKEIALLRGNSVPSASCLDADLRVQFGWLSPEQIVFINTQMGGVQNYFGAAIRTNYDQELLRGKGFIYLKPDTGPLSSQSPGTTPNPWNLGRGYLIDKALQHELGHVFGLPHKDIETIMAVDYLERIFHQADAEENANYPYERGYFSWNMSDGSIIREFCSIRAGWRNFLSIPPDHNCYQVKFEGGRVVFRSGEKPDGAGVWSDRGSMEIDPKITFMWEEAVRLYLTPAQTVITRFPSGSGYAPWYMGPMIKNTELSGTFVSQDRRMTRKVFITLSPAGLGFAASRFSVEMNGQWYWNLDWEN